MSDGTPSPNPDFTQQIKNVTGNANVKIQNKNLAILRNDLTSYGASVDTTVIKNDNTGKVISTLIPIKPNTIYTLYREKSTPLSNTRCFYYDTSPVIDETISISGNYISTGANLVTIITTPPTAKWLFVRWTSDNDTNPCGDVQILEGSYTEETIPSYVPHQEQNYPFTFAEGQRAMQGTQLLDDGIHQKRKQIVLDGTENWQLATNPDFFYLEIITKKADNEIMIISSHFKGVSFNDRGNGETNIIYSAGTYIVLRNTDFTTINELKAFLAEQYANGTPVKVEYELAESELENNIIPYNETQQAQYNDIEANATSYDDITYITSTSDELSPELEIQYWKERGV